MCGVDIYHRFSANRKRSVRPTLDSNPTHRATRPSFTTTAERTTSGSFREPGQSKLYQNSFLPLVLVCGVSSVPTQENRKNFQMPHSLTRSLTHWHTDWLIQLLLLLQFSFKPHSLESEKPVKIGLPVCFDRTTERPTNQRFVLWTRFWLHPYEEKLLSHPSNDEDFSAGTSQGEGNVVPWCSNKGHLGRMCQKLHLLPSP